MQNPASVMVCGCIGTHGMGDSNMCEGTIATEVYNGTFFVLKLKVQNWVYTHF